MKINGGKLAAWLVATGVVVALVAIMVPKVLLPAVQSAPLREMGALTLPDVLFYLLAAVTVAGAAGVALSRNILYSCIGLLAALLGAGSLYVLLSADFVAVTQLLIYIGGVLVLVLFAVMLTNRITEVNVSNSSFGLWGGVLLFVAVVPVLLTVAVVTPWQTITPAELAPTTQAIGDAFLTKWLLPFEVASLVLLATLVGAIVIARKEIKADEA
jgi:NAD(P)H-quinone oxidoreductase subunit 6